MILKKISLFNYKNIENMTLVFNPKINCLIGNNGVGKSNILDAIYLICFGKSYFNPIATQNIKIGEAFFIVEGIFEKKKKIDKVNCSLKNGQKKKLKCNGKIYEKLSEHIGKFPLVIISPTDNDLINEGSTTRRKFIDSIIGQGNKIYLNQLINYNKVLQQRNQLLKLSNKNNHLDIDTLEIYNQQLCSLGNRIFKTRTDFFEKFIPIFKQQYKNISQGKEKINIEYLTDLKKYSFENILKKSLDKDRLLQYTTKGIHKDDLIFLIQKKYIKKFGSQGQQKSFIIALKLAQFDFLKNNNNATPLLLLDDIFDKLDNTRVKQIIHLVKEKYFGQIFISDTNQDRIENILKPTQLSYKIFNIS